VPPFSLRELFESAQGTEHDRHARTVNPQFVRVLRTIGFDRRWARASMQYIYDDEGNRYLDWLGGFGMFNVGRNNPRIRAALEEALALDLPNSVQLGISPLPSLLAEQLLALAPASLGRVLFCNSGAEAIEAALKLGRAATGRSRVLSAAHGFHGLTLGALSINGNPEFTGRFAPLLPDTGVVPFGDLEALERDLAREDVAIFVVEPVQGKGVKLPAPEYLQGAQALCRRYGTLFCVDEIQTGFGRTGRMFACEHWGLEPDVMPVAKSLSGGYIPIGACLLRTEVFDAVFSSMENAVSHGSTFAPNDIAIAAGLATLHELEQERLVERSARLGELLLERTRPLVERHEVVKETRGLGLMWAIEFQEPPAGSRTWRWLDRIQPALFAQLVVVPLFTEHRVLSQVAGHNLNVLKGLPPLCVTEQDVEDFVEALDRTLVKAQRLPSAMMRFAIRAARASRAKAPEPVGVR
jgi:ornithine--oxo-acid transaminase